MNPYLIALVILIVYFLILYVLNRLGAFSKYGLKLVGPIIMWKTTRGKKLIENLSKPRSFWRAYSLVAKGICFGGMIFIMALLIWEATIVSRIPAEKAPGPELLLGIPGINPIIPLGYGIVGLIVAIVVHEFAHGILTRVGGISLKSLGLIFLVIPLGAFVEPDEEELAKSEKKKKTSVYAVGPASNIVLAFICALIFSSVLVTSAVPERPSPIITSVTEDSPAYHAGLKFGTQIIKIGEKDIKDLSDIQNISGFEPGQTINVQYYYAGELLNVEVTAGVVVTMTAPGLPAENSGIKPGMIIASINDTIIHNQREFMNAMALTKPNQTVNITVLAYYDETGEYEVFEEIRSVKLASKLEYYQRVAPELIGPEFQDIGYLGVNTAFFGASANSPDVVLRRLAHPFAGVNSFGSMISSALSYIALPFSGLAPIRSPLSELFIPSGILAVIPADIFWVMANCMYWIFWINLMVGLTNVLPAVPLDGGYLFRDWLDSFVKALKKDSTEKEREKYIATITYALALTVLALILWQLIGPRIT
ncbi:MAG: site-2 protease family protein [Methanomassiliicoccales archaeon]